MMRAQRGDQGTRMVPATQSVSWEQKERAANNEGERDPGKGRERRMEGVEKAGAGKTCERDGGETRRGAGGVCSLRGG